jgi:hypothetical protein
MGRAGAGGGQVRQLQDKKKEKIKEEGIDS